MKNGIDLLLILVLLATIGLLVYFGLDNGTVAEPVSPTSALISTSSIKVVSASETAIPTQIQTATLIPASVTIPTKTATFTARPSQTATKIPTASSTETAAADITPVSSLVQEINTAIERGNRIVQAVEAYYSATGVYPTTLNSLTPAYLPDLPMTSTGQAYFYRLFDASSPLASDVYWVSFRAINQDHVACTYFRRLDYWDCDYASP
jgi:hypothetical protein